MPTWMLMTLVAVAACAVVALVLVLSGFWRADVSEEFAGDPVQAQLTAIVAAYAFSAQDEAAYAAFSRAVRAAFSEIGMSSGERVRRRLAAAADQAVRSDPARPMSQDQLRGAVLAIHKFSEAL